MTTTKTLKKYSDKIVTLTMALAIVFALFLLQAFSISGKEKTKLVKIYTPPSTQKIEKEEVAEPKKTLPTQNSIGASEPQKLNAQLPKIASADFKLPAYKLSDEIENLNNFSISLFNSSNESRFDVEIFSLDMLDKIPSRIDHTKVVYPKQMLNRNIEGEVKLMVLIDITGVLTIEDVLSSTNNYFKQSALEAVTRFVYEPPTRAGKPVKARFVLPIPFKINK